MNSSDYSKRKSTDRKFSISWLLGREWNILFSLCFIMFCSPSCESGGSEIKKSKNKPLSNDNQPAVVTASSDLLTRILKVNGEALLDANQIILVTNDQISETNVSIQTYEKKNNHWIKKFTHMEGTIGHNGFSHYGAKREGDKTSPTGIYELGLVFGYADMVHTKMEYRQATINDYWIDDVKSTNYNKWVRLDAPPSYSHERMKRSDHVYKLGFVINHNIDPIIKGNGSAIFMHVEWTAGTSTAGCVALPERDLAEIVGWLDPEQSPVVVMGTKNELCTQKL